MGRTAIEMTGKKFGRLTVIGIFARSEKNGEIQWSCLCDCGGQTVAFGSSLRQGNKISCGCAANTGEQSIKHGLHGAPGYYSWACMIQRCKNMKSTKWKDYGGRGITVCDRWLRFENFFEDMGPKPPGKTLDRIDNSNGYEPDNCRWATPLQQGRNTRRNIILRNNGKAMTLSQWAEEIGVNYYTLHKRLCRGWDDEKVLTTPVENSRKS